MLHPIRLPDSHIALSRTVELQRRLMAWLCNPATPPDDVTAESVPQREPDVSDWLAWFVGKKGILPAMQHLAGLPDAEKVSIHARFDAALRFPEHFDANNPAPMAWPAGLTADTTTSAHLKTLLEEFYSDAFSSDRGLPYDAGGNPVGHGLRRRQYVSDFRKANCDRVCPGCDGDLNAGEEFDHWIGKARYPCLSVYPENLVLLCHKCNSAECKGQRPTYSAGALPFAEWFHPWLRQAAGKFQVAIQEGKAAPTAIDAQDAERVGNLDRLLHLSERWSIELNSQIDECLTVLEVLLEENEQATEANAVQWVDRERRQVLKSIGKKPHALVSKALLDDALTHPSTIRAWMEEARKTITQRASP